MCSEDTKQKIVEELMTRDGISEREARKLIAITQIKVDEAMDEGCPMDDAEEIIMEHLGLDGSYLMDFI